MANAILAKYCGICATTKRQSDFHKNCRSKDGFAARCKDCNKLYNREYSAKNKAAVALYMAEYQAKNKESIRQKNLEYCLANKDRLQAYRAEHYTKNKERVLENTALWQRNNPEKVAARNKRWADANPEKVRANNKKNEKVRGQNRRALVRRAVGKLSKDLPAKLFALQGGKCPCCAQPLGNNYHLDHIVPLALGGRNSDDNAQLLRRTCNLQKNKKDPLDFMQSRGFLL
jgi:5-methylcytosine-specific restriction endonuclease McrA